MLARVQNGREMIVVLSEVALTPIIMLARVQNGREMIVVLSEVPMERRQCFPRALPGPHAQALPPRILDGIAQGAQTALQTIPGLRKGILLVLLVALREEDLDCAAPEVASFCDKNLRTRSCLPDE